MKGQQRKKDGEKALLLQACGELLFDCVGENRTTQGIYFTESEEKQQCFCKRAVWVPRAPRLEELKQKFEDFGASLPAFVSDSDVIIGLCGKNPTRNAHAVDCSFFILAQTPTRKFFPIAVAGFDHSGDDEKLSVSLRSISSDPEAIDHCIAWIQKEALEYEKEKCTKKPKQKHKRLRPSSGIANEDDDDESKTTLCPNSLSEPHRVFSQPEVLRSLKRRCPGNVNVPAVYTTNNVSAQEALYPLSNVTFPSDSLLVDLPPSFPAASPSLLGSSMQLETIDPQMKRSSTVIGSELDSISSPEHVSTPLINNNLTNHFSYPFISSMDEQEQHDLHASDNFGASIETAALFSISEENSLLFRSVPPSQ